MYRKRVCQFCTDLCSMSAEKLDEHNYKYVAFVQNKRYSKTREKNVTCDNMVRRSVYNYYLYIYIYTRRPIFLISWL